MNLPPVKSLKPLQGKDNKNFNHVSGIIHFVSGNIDTALIACTLPGLPIANLLALVALIIWLYGLLAYNGGQCKGVAVSRPYLPSNSVIATIHLHFKTLVSGKW